jgi:hypothetical protein
VSFFNSLLGLFTGIPTTIRSPIPIWTTDHNDYQYWDNSTAPVQPESFNRATGNSPTVIVINTGNPRPMDSRSNTGYVNSGYSLTDAARQQRMAVRNPNEKIGPQADPRTFVPPAVPQPTQTAAKGTQITPQAQTGVFGNLVLVSWLEDAGKDVIYVQNTETNNVQKITSEPNLDNFRIVELHPNADPKLSESRHLERKPTRTGQVPFLTPVNFLKKSPSAAVFNSSLRAGSRAFELGVKPCHGISSGHSRVVRSIICWSGNTAGALEPAKHGSLTPWWQPCSASEAALPSLTIVD